MKNNLTVKNVYTYARVSIPLINHHIFKAVVKPRNIPQPYEVNWYRSALKRKIVKNVKPPSQLYTGR